LPDAAVTIVATQEQFASPHVLAIMAGSDPRLRDEHVVYTAHLDGLGQGNPVNGDPIYNGAIDNGLGSAILLTIAQAFARLDDPPKRSLVFIATTGEELGIQGSPYFVEHPTIPPQSIVAVINIDGPSLLTDPVGSVLAMGAENSTLGESTRAAAKQLGLNVNGATAPLNYSDHFPFVMKGIPALWIVEEGATLPSEARDAARRSIHMPTDDMNRSFRWDAAVTLARLNFLIGHQVANASERPRWNAGDVLGEKFGRPAVR
jgi:Zn-dependent M28 family amino/carboxypeptidase